MKHILFLINLLLFFVVFNWGIMSKEDTLSNGKMVYLELAPADPRSLFQGDYMRLEYQLLGGLGWKDSLYPESGYCLLKLDSLNVARTISYIPELHPFQAEEVAVRFHYNATDIRIGAESYFFEEGKSWTLDSARYGAIKISKKGEPILIGLYDRHLRYLDTRRDSATVKLQ